MTPPPCSGQLSSRVHTMESLNSFARKASRHQLLAKPESKDAAAVAVVSSARALGDVDEAALMARVATISGLP